MLVVGATTAAIGVLSYAQAKTALDAAARARLELLARDMTRNLHGEITDRVADIMTWTRLETMLALTFGDVDKELAEFMRHAIHEQRAYRTLVAFDRDGAIVASAGEPTAAVRPSAAGYRPLLRVFAAPADGAPALILETRVANPQRPSEAIGHLVAVLDPGRLLDAMAAPADAMGTPIAITVAIDGGATVLTRAPGPDDAAVLEAHAVVPPVRDVDAPTFVVTVREPAVVALAGVESLRRTLVRLGLVVLLLSAIAGGLLAWRVSLPIRRLTAAVREIASPGGPMPPVASLPVAAGEVGILSAAFRDMLERLAVAQREAIAQSRLALLGEVAASVAHDVRTPLSVLKTSAQLLAAGDIPVAEEHALAQMVAAEVDRLNAVVSQLVDLGRTRSPRMAPEPVMRLVESAVGIVRPWARAASVQIDQELPSAVCRVRVDRDHMQQVLLNLLQNAVQAVSPDGRVTVGMRVEPPWAVVEVRDDGPGFSSEALRRAFSPFFTTKPEGTGLGLTIAKRIVEEQGGDVGVRNVQGGGACVWIRLPIIAEAT